MMRLRREDWRVIESGAGVLQKIKHRKTFIFLLDFFYMRKFWRIGSKKKIEKLEEEFID